VASHRNSMTLFSLPRCLMAKESIDNQESVRYRAHGASTQVPHHPCGWAAARTQFPFGFRCRLASAHAALGTRHILIFSWPNSWGLSINKGCILARAPGGQMQGDATQAMRCHRRGAATQQMPALRNRCLRAVARRPAGFVARSLDTARYG
jgi:hypothetical protein